MLPTQYLLLEQRQLSRHRQGIADLPPVHLLVSQLIYMSIQLVEVNVFFVGAQHVEEVLPNLFLRDAVEGGVVQGDLDAI